MLKKAVGDDGSLFFPLSSTNRGFFSINFRRLQEEQIEVINRQIDVIYHFYTSLCVEKEAGKKEKKDENERKDLSLHLKWGRKRSRTLR